MQRRLLLLGALLAIDLVLAACQAAPTPTPTTPPATPTPVPQMSAPTPTSPPAATAPTAAAPAATPTRAAPTPTPAPVSKGKVVLAASAEPGSMDVVIESYNVNSRPVYPSMVEHLTKQNPKTFAIEPSLAEKWEQVKPDTWRYTLRKGVKFHNGEAFNADAVVYALNRTADKELGSRGQRFWPIDGKAVKVDETTVDVTSPEADPIQPLRVMFVPVVAPKHAQENPEELPLKPIGTGPYKFVEWVKGQYLRMTAFDGYWGSAPKIKDATILWRAEAQVRTAMVKSGEADWAFNLTPDQANEVAKFSAVGSNETIDVRLDTENPVLKDKRVRLAVNLAIDREGIIKNLYGGFADSAQGQINGDYVIGFNKEIKEYPFDMERAKKLVAEAKAEGIPIDGPEMEIWVSKGRLPRIEEMAEFLADTWRQLGMKTKVVVAEQAKWLDMYYAVGPGQKRAAFVLTGLQNELGDSARTFDASIACGGRASVYCNKELTDKGKKAGAAVGEERAKLYREAWQVVYDEALFTPLFRPKPLYGLSKRLIWEARMDQMVMVQDMSLAE